MKKIAVLIALITVLSACDKTINKYYVYEPVYTDAETFRTPAAFETPRSFQNDGNIYFKDDYLFVVEPNQGIHFIDNSNPSNPVNIGFLNVMGCSGLAIKGNYLYITALVDMVIVDVSVITNPVEVGREEDIFPTALPLTEKNYPFKEIDKSKGIVTSFKVIRVKEEANTTSSPVWNNCFNCETMTFSSADASSGSGGGSSTGTAGSFAQMTIVNDHLYVIDMGINKLRPFNIGNPLSPQEGEASWLSWNVETIFPHGDYLYMGTTTGMMIYNTVDPMAPQYVGSISHARACDPVVVQGNYAYVTVRSGGSCGGDINQLDVVDVSDKSNPFLKASFNLENPHGLGIDGNTLFVCDGDAGLKVYDATNPEEAGDHLIKRFKNIQATDVIPLNGVVMVIGDDGIYQYDYSDPANLKLLSKLR
ncbi:MAG: hypothetical protein WDZ35_01140 [Crocinitomicaceae bacterium]